MYLKASRATFQHIQLDETSARKQAMDEMMNGLDEVYFEGEDFEHPVVYSFMYVNWEANEVSKIKAYNSGIILFTSQSENR